MRTQEAIATTAALLIVLGLATVALAPASTASHVAGDHTPSADAGESGIVADADGDGVEEVLLNGTGTSDSHEDDSDLQYEWKVDGVAVAYSQKSTEELDLGEHDVTLTVTDSEGNEDSDSITVTVSQAPIADAGEDISVVDREDDGADTVELNASASEDRNGQALSYTWSLNGSTIATGETADVSFDAAEESYEVNLTVEDPDGNVDTDSVNVTVSEPSVIVVCESLADAEDCGLTSINTAIDRAERGSQSVAVEAGDYDEHVVLDKGVPVIANGEVNLTDSTGDEVVLIEGDDMGDAEFSGFDVAAASDDSAAIRVNATFLTPGLLPIQVTDNEIDASGAVGIDVVDSNATRIKDNAVSGASDGIAIAASSGLFVRQNDISGSSADGLAIADGSSDLFVARNTIEASGDDGIEVASSVADLSLTLNTVSGSAGAGLQVADTGSVSLEDTKVTANDFSDNGLQVDASAAPSKVDTSELSDVNDFDERVLVYSPSGDAMPTIWSSIQDAVDNAATGSQVDVASGTYSEKVSVQTDGLQISAAAGAELVSDSDNNAHPTLGIAADGVLVEGLDVTRVVKSNAGASATEAISVSFDQSGDSAEPADVALRDLSVSLVDETGQEDSGPALRVSNSWTPLPSRAGITVDVRNVDATTNAADSAALAVHEAAASVDVSVLGGSFTDSDRGVYVGTGAPSVSIAAADIAGNADYGVLNDGSGTVDATHNWWGSELGPTHDDNTYSATGETGDAVSDGVEFSPWCAEAGCSATLSALPVSLPDATVADFQASGQCNYNSAGGGGAIGASVGSDGTAADTDPDSSEDGAAACFDAAAAGSLPSGGSYLAADAGAADGSIAAGASSVPVSDFLTGESDSFGADAQASGACLDDAGDGAEDAGGLSADTDGNVDLVPPDPDAAATAITACAGNVGPPGPGSYLQISATAGPGAADGNVDTVPATDLVTGALP